MDGFKHTTSDLIQMQSLPLEAKIIMAKRRIVEWYEHFDGDVYVSFSGGKDSTVLKHIVDSLYDDVPSVFVNTGLEYPEIQKFVKEIKSGKYDCFNSDVVIVRPEMRFDEVIEKYGYPVISKEVSRKIHECRSARKHGNYNSYAERQFNGTYLSKKGKKNLVSVQKWKFLCESDIKVSHMCCNIMKKRTMHQYEMETKRLPIIGTMASESMLRRENWLKNGCNSFDSKKASSQPLSFWTQQDIYHYLKLFNVPYADVYGEIVTKSKNQVDGQISMNDMIGCCCEDDQLQTTGVDRTGCMFCMYGVHLEKEPNRFQKMKITHPKQYEYCMKPVEQGGLGLAKVLDFIGVKYD